MNHLTRFVPALLLVALFPFSAYSQEEPIFIVSTSWVADRLNDENLVLLHVGARDQYDSTHIPGAEYISLSEISTPRTPASILEFPEIDQLVPHSNRREFQATLPLPSITGRTGYRPPRGFI